MPPETDNSPTLVTHGVTSVDIRVILGSTTPPGRMHRAIDGAIERAAARGTSADLVDQLFTGVAATAAALDVVDAVAEPLPLGAKAVKPRAKAAG